MSPNVSIMLFYTIEVNYIVICFSTLHCIFVSIKIEITIYLHACQCVWPTITIYQQLLKNISIYN